MVNVKYWLDKRKRMADGRYPLKVMLSQSSQTRVLKSGFSIEEKKWDGDKQKVLGRDAAPMNRKLTSLMKHIEAEVEECATLESAASVVKSITCDSEDKKSRTLSSLWDEFIETRVKETTKEAYLYTKSVVMSLMDIETLDVADVTGQWLERLREKMSKRGLSNNSSVAYLNRIHAVLSIARRRGLVINNPFADVKLKKNETRHRFIDVETLRRIRDAGGNTKLLYFRDMFMLSFYLIGMNSVDMFNAKDSRGGRIQYERSKTGKVYDIKVEPEAKAIIERHKGDDSLLDISKRYNSVSNFTSATSAALKFYSPGLSMYWARHTWATTAAELNVPMEVISAALGHSCGLRVTNVYVAVKLSKVDAANRLVLDYLRSNFTDAESFLKDRFRRSGWHGF